MRTSLAASACLAAFWLIDISPYGGDRSRPVTILALVLAAASFLLGLCGLAIALFGQVPDRQRSLVLLLSIVPVLIAGGFWLFGLALILGPHD
jgi:hypothetical protein